MWVYDYYVLLAYVCRSESEAGRSRAVVLLIHKLTFFCEHEVSKRDNVLLLVLCLRGAFVSASLQGLCEEVETGLIYLEAVCDTQQLQERKLDARFGLALHREATIARLNDAKGTLVCLLSWPRRTLLNLIYDKRWPVILESKLVLCYGK